MLLLPIINLPHASRYYRLVINRSEVSFLFLLTETNLTSKLSWNRGISEVQKRQLWQTKHLHFIVFAKMLVAQYFFCDYFVSTSTKPVVTLKSYDLSPMS